jgi:hypothetical protein
MQEPKTKEPRGNDALIESCLRLLDLIVRQSTPKRALVAYGFVLAGYTSALARIDPPLLVRTDPVSELEL